MILRAAGWRKQCIAVLNCMPLYCMLLLQVPNLGTDDDSEDVSCLGLDNDTAGPVINVQMIMGSVSLCFDLL